jgi:hypothetical protein
MWYICIMRGGFRQAVGRGKFLQMFLFYREERPWRCESV